MVVKTFSYESVESARAGILLGMDVVERCIERISDKMETCCEVLYVTGIHGSMRISNTWFPEVLVGECISLTYIINYEVCNNDYK